MANLEDLQLNGFTTVGNIYVDSKYTIETTPAVDPITGEALVFGENAFSEIPGGTASVIPEDGHALFLTNINLGGDRIYNGRMNGGGSLYDVYASGIVSGDIYVMPRQAGNYTPDEGGDGVLDVWIEGTSIASGGYHGLSATAGANLIGDYNVTIKNSTMQYLAVATGSAWGVDNGTASNHRFATVEGDINFVLDNLTVTSVAGVARGVVGSAADQAKITGVITNSKFGNNFHIIMTGVDANGQSFNSYTDIDITITGSSFSGAWMTLPNQSSASRNDRGELTTHGNISIKMTGTTVNGLVVGGGRSGTGWQRVGWVDGDIELKLNASTTGLTYINKGYVGHSADALQTVTATIENKSVVGNLVAYELRGDKGDKVYANSTISVTASTIGNFTFLTSINSGGNTNSVNNRLWGVETVELTGAVAGNLLSASGDQADATFQIVVKPSETESKVGNINRWKTITVEAGAKLRAATIEDVETITLNGANALSAEGISGVTTLSVLGEFEGDTILVSGLASYDDANIGTVLINGTAYSYGILPGSYSYVNGNLVAHIGDTVLVNSNYEDGEMTELGVTGYTSFASAMQAIDPAVTSISLYTGDETVEPNVFTENLVTKNFTISFLASESERASLDGFALVIGDTTAVDSAEVSVLYTDNIKNVKIGSVTGKAVITLADVVGTEENDGMIEFLDMTDVTVGEADINVSKGRFTDVKLANEAGFVGTLTISESEITNLYNAVSGLTVDLTGGNRIENLYAENNGAALQLGTSTVEKYVAGYKNGGVINEMVYNDGVSAHELILGGDEVANTIASIDATVKGGEISTLHIGGENDNVTGNVKLAFEGGDVSEVKFANIGGALDATFTGGHFSNFVVENVTGKANVTLAGGTVALAPDGTFYGLVYGASVSDALDGGSTGNILNVEGNAKVGSVANFKALNVTGGTLNVAGGDKKSSVSDDSNTLVIDGNILNRRGINAGSIQAKTLTNYGLVGVLRDSKDNRGIVLSGNLLNESYIKTSVLSVAGSFTNNGKVTSVGDITVNGTFTNKGEIYFRSTFSRDGKFTQEGGIVLTGVDLKNEGFISAATLSGVRNLTTSKLYVTGGAAITGNITITAGAEVAFTNKANRAATALTLGGNITIADTANLIVSGNLTTSGTKTITINVGDLIGVNEIVHAEGGVDSWTINLSGANAGNYGFAQTATSVTIYSLDTVYVSSSFSADGVNKYDGHTLLYGTNAFATVDEAVAAAKAGAKIYIMGECGDVNAAGFDVILDGAVAGDVSAKTITVSKDSSVNSIAAADALTIDASAKLSVTETIPTTTELTIDASKGAGSRLVLDVDITKVTLDASSVTIIGPAGKAYTAYVLPLEGDNPPAHAGDLYLISNDNAFYVPSLFKAEGEALVPTFVDGDTFDRATGDALFAGVNTFGDKDQAKQVAKDVNGVFVLVDSVVNNAVGEEDVLTMIEVDRARGDSGQSRAIVGIHDDGSTKYESDQDHTTIIAGSTSTGNVYGLTRWYDMSGDYKLVVQDSVSTGSALWIAGNNDGNVMNGNITAEITGSTFQNIYLGTGSFGTDETKPIDIDITIRDSRLNGFYGIHTQRGNNDPANRQDVNANFTVRIYDSTVAGGTITFLNTNNDNYSGTDVTQLQTYYTAGSITLELGGVSMEDGNIRIGGSLEVSGKAFQAFNVPNTVHIVATDNSTVTHCDWVCDVDTLIVDATAQLLIDNALQYATVDKGSDNAIDYGGTLTQVMINMSGYKSGTHKVIQANYNPSYGGTRGIYTDNDLSNISVIGDNDLTGQCELAYLTQTRDGDTYLNSVYVFDKSDDMFINTTYTDAINGTTASTGQELLLNYNAHTSFKKALDYTNVWHGTITVAGGAFEDQAFYGNNVTVQSGVSFKTITMGGSTIAWNDATLTLAFGSTAETVDGSKSQLGSSVLNLAGGTFGAVKDFTTVNFAKDTTTELKSLSGSDLSLYASSVIKAESLNLSNASITIDVTGYAGRPHAVIMADGITGFDPTKVTLTGTGLENYGVIQSGNNIVLTTSIQSDTYLDSTYTPETTGTILEDGTYLQYGFNAFSDVASAAAALGGKANTLTVMGGEFTDNVLMEGANFVMEEGVFGGIIYGASGNSSGMNITVKAGSIGGIDLTAGEGAYSVTKAAITLGDGVTVTGGIVGGGDTALTVGGSLQVGSIEGVGSINLVATGLIETDYIEMSGTGRIHVAAGGVKIEEGNLRKIISTQAGITGASYSSDAGFSVYARGNDVYLMDLSRIYFDASYDQMITGTTLSNGDVLSYGVNAFGDLNSAVAAARTNNAMLYVQNRTANTTITGTPVVDLTVVDSNIGSLQHGLSNAQNAGNDHEVHVVIKNSLINSSDGFIMGEGTWQNRNTFTGNFTLDVTGSTFGNGRTRIGTFFVEGNKNFLINITDSTMLGDLSIIEDSPFGNSDKVTINLTNVNAPVTKWWSFFDGYPGEGGGTINVNIKDSVLGAANNNFRFGAQRSCGNSNNVATNFNFTVENTTVNGALAIERIDGNTGNLINYTGTAVLNLIGENKIRYALKFTTVNMTADASISGSTMTLRGGDVNIDATGYEGETKAFIYMSTEFSGYGAVNVTGLDTEKYTLITSDNAVVISDGSIKNVYWNREYESKNTGFTTQYGDVLIVYNGDYDPWNPPDPEDEDIDVPTIENAYTDLETAKQMLPEGYKLVVTDADLAHQFYGTLETTDVTPYVNFVLTTGDFTEEDSIVAAADLNSGFVIDGDSTIEIAGGTYGKAAVLNDEGDVEEEAIFAEINGTRDVVGGTSGLLVTYSSTMYANFRDFDYLVVEGDVKVMGDISEIGSLIIDCAKGSLTVEGQLDAGYIDYIRLNSADYEGPSKIVLTSDSLDQIDPSIISVDAPDRVYYDGNGNLWLVSNDPCNVYLNSTYTEAIDGTVVNGDLLIYGMNAFSSMDEAIAKAASGGKYTMYVLGGSFNDVYDLTGKGQLNIQVDAGNIGGFIVDDGGDSDHRSTIRVTGNTGNVNIGSLSAVEGSTVGYRVVANKNTTIGTIDGVQYFRFDADSNVTVGSIAYRENGGSLYVDMANYTGASSVVLKVNGGIENFYQPVAGQTFSRNVVGASNNTGYTLYYDENSKSIVANRFGNVAILSGTASADYNGKTISFGGQTTTLAYGYNVSEWNVSGLGANITSDGILYVEGGFYNGVFYTNNPIQNIDISGATINGLVAGYNEVAGGSTRIGDYNLTVEGSTFTWFGAFAGRGTADAHAVFIVGNTVYNPDTEEYDLVNGTYNFTFTNSTHDTNDFFLTRYGNISGGTANVTFDNYRISGDLQLFSYVWNGEDDELDAVNVTMNNVFAPASKWMWIWDPQETNHTKITLTITDSVFNGDDHTLGLFGSHANGDWEGQADVFISGLTMSQGRLTGARGVNTGDTSGRVKGTRTLHVAGENNIALVKEFTTIDIAADAVLTGGTISLPVGTYSDAAFILRGETGYTGEVREYAVVGTTINAEGATAKFLDANDQVIEGYVAVIGSTSLFIYNPNGDVFFSSTYNSGTTGAAVTEADGSKNFLVYGDNAVNSLPGAYASVDARGGNAAIRVINTVSGNMYAKGYKMVLGAGTLVTRVYGTTTSTEGKEVEFATVDLTLNSGATVTNLFVASQYATVAGDAVITVGEGAVVTGVLDGTSDYVGGTSTLKFVGSTTVKGIQGFDVVSVDANAMVTVSDSFAGANITIDASNFADFTKKVMYSENGFEGVTISVIGAGFGYEILDDGKTLLVTSDIVGNAYVNGDWTEADVQGKFVGETALVWNKNAFSSVASAAAAVAADSTLFIEGGASSEAASVTNAAVVVSANTTGTAVGALTATNGATLTVENDAFSAAALSGFSAISLKAGAVDVAGGIALAADATITIDVTGYKVEGDSVALSTGTGITGITDTTITVVGEGAGAYYAYYDEEDGDVHLLRVNNYYVDVNYGTAGQGIVEGQVDPTTGENLIFGVNAFYYLNDVRAIIQDGQGLYIYNRTNAANTNDVQVSDLFISGSTISQLVAGHTTGNQVYFGDVNVTIVYSVIATGGESWLVGNSTTDNGYDAVNRIFGDVNVLIQNSVIGSAEGDAQTFHLYDFTNVYGVPGGTASTVSLTIEDTEIFDNILFIGDSQMGNPYDLEVEGGTVTCEGASDLVITMDGVMAGDGLTWRIRGGSSNSHGTVTVNLIDTVIGSEGANTTRFAIENNWGTWGNPWNAPDCSSDFVFNLTDTIVNGYLIAGRYDLTEANDQNPDIPSYTGNRILSISGNNYINDTRYFKELVIDAEGSLFGSKLQMFSTDATITIDATGYTGYSRVVLSMDSAIENITLDSIALTQDEGATMSLVTDATEAGAVSLVVLKGAIKDIYASADYSADMELGTTYGDEALFFGENAFQDVGLAIAALTDGADLYATGNVVYTGSDVITISGDLYNEGNFVISAAGFIGGGQSDVVVLTAESISGSGTFRTDDAGYAISVVENTVHLIQKKLDVYVNTAWGGLEQDTVVDVPGGTAIIGTDAFATADAAAAQVSANGSITILASTVEFTSAIVRTVTATSGSVVVNANVGASAAGSLTLESGAVATNANVRNGSLTVNAGAAINGSLAMLEGVTVTFAEGSALNIDISGMISSDNAPVTNLNIITGTPAYAITVAADQADGTYSVATEAYGFNSTVTLQTTDAVLGTITVDNTVEIAGVKYTLSVTDNDVLTLTIGNDVPPTPTTFVAKGDINGNGISDVMFVWTGTIEQPGNYQHGFWMDGTNTWQSQNGGHPAEWENLGCYDMSGDGLADSVLVGNVVVNEVKGAYIGYYADAIDAVDGSTWVNIGYLTNADDIVWKNKVGNLTGNGEGANSIVWFAPELCALGAWTDGTDNWVSMASTFDSNWSLVGCGDFDGDGKDSVVMSGANGQYFYTADVDGTVVSMGNANWSGWEVRAIGDFSGDGKDDMVLFHEDTGSIVMLADGNLDDFKSIGQLDAEDWFVVGAGDYNNDQKDDLLVRQFSSGMLGYYSSGDTTQWNVLGYGVGMEWTVIA